jgi:hypothetical protein
MSGEPPPDEPALPSPEPDEQAPPEIAPRVIAPKREGDPLWVVIPTAIVLVLATGGAWYWSKLRARRSDAMIDCRDKLRKLPIALEGTDDEWLTPETVESCGTACDAGEELSCRRLSAAMVSTCFASKQSCEKMCSTIESESGRRFACEALEKVKNAPRNPGPILVPVHSASATTTGMARPTATGTTRPVVIPLPALDPKDQTGIADCDEILQRIMVCPGTAGDALRTRLDFYKEIFKVGDDPKEREQVTGQCRTQLAQVRAQCGDAH